MRNLAGRLCGAALLLLSGCASHVAQYARTDLRGMSVAALETCAGLPSKTGHPSKDVTLLVYDGDQHKGASVSVEFLAKLNLNLAPSSTCNAVFRVEGDRVVSVRYTGDTTSLWGDYSGCADLVRECVRYPDFRRP